MRKTETRERAANTGAPRHHRWLPGCAGGLLASAALALGCGKAVTTPTVGSETHFLDACGIDGCDAGLVCIAGLCTRACESNDQCTDLDARAVCSAPGSAGSCQLEATPSTCPAPSQPGLAEPLDIDTGVTQIPGARSVLAAVADATGLYWMETDGSVMALSRGSDTSLVLRPPAPGPAPLVTLLSDRDYLYWDELALPAKPPGTRAADSPQPQGLLYRLPKSGGEPELILRMNNLLRPLAATDSALLLVAGGDELYALEPQALRRVEAVPSSTGLQIRDNLAYWTVDSANPPVSELFSAPLSGGPARRLGELPQGEFLVGNGVVLARREQLLAAPRRLAEHFLRVDTTSGCVEQLPGLEQHIGPAIIDDHHVYWRSANSDPGATPLAAPPELALVRMDLQSLRIERLVSPGLPPALDHDIVAQDAEHLYLRVNGVGPLLAVRKPESEAREAP